MKLRRLAAVVLMMCGSAQAQLQAKWIAAPWSTMRDGAELDGSRPMPIFRREFTVRGQVRNAELRIAGMGQFEARIGSVDGVNVVGLPGLHQAWTDYRKTVTYESYDVTRWTTPGRHSITVMVGNGMYNVQRSQANGKSRYSKFEGSFGAPKMIAELRLRFADGHTETIASDATWKTARGPVLFSSTYGGEDFDARQEQAGWDGVGFNDSGWDAAASVDGPGGKLIPAIAPEVRMVGNHFPGKPVDVGQGRVVYDLGQNFAGVPDLEVVGSAGMMLKLTPGELLKADGTVNQASSGGPMWWSYTLRGSKAGETWTPQFGYYGFRYLQAEWVNGTGSILNVRGDAWSSASPIAGTFESSNAMLNAIDKLIVNAVHNNEMSVFTDCPHREKFGWLEETHLVAPGMMFNNDLRGLYAATERNMADAQLEDGDVPTTAPRYTKFSTGRGRFDDSPEWGSASVLAPWWAYKFYGDLAPLRASYATMQRYVAYLKGGAKDGIVAYGLGDWYDIGPGPPGVSKLTTLGVTGTLMLYEDAAVMQRMAGLLHKPDDVESYSRLANEEKDAFNARFFDAARGYYDTGSQSAQAMPLALGIVPPEARAGVLAKLLADIREHNDHVTTGEIGFPYMVRALTEAGRSDVLMAILMRRDAPSYGAQIAAGATALTEAWDANPRSSQDHFMLGGAEEWLYRGLGGIDVDMSRAVEAERIMIHPQFVDGVDWVKTSYHSALGMVSCVWRRRGKTISLTLTVPVASSIEVDGKMRVVKPGAHSFSMPSPTRSPGTLPTS